MSLEKAIIKNVDTGEEIPVMFNPREFTLEKSTPWREHDIQGLDAPAVEFTTGERKRLSLELLFDTYEQRTSVKDEHTDHIMTLLEVNKETHRPPICIFLWGKFQFKCVIENLTQRFTMFLSDGTPVRATLNVTFVEYTTSLEQMQKTRRQSADHEKSRVVKRGETLYTIAAREYEDPSKWRVIAEANSIDHPLEIEPGTKLHIPPIM